MKKFILILGLIFIASLLSSENYQAGDDNLIIMPTAYTMEAGQSYFSDYELLFIDYHFALSSELSFGCATLFPITTDFMQTITLRARFKYLDLQTFKSTLWGAYVIKPGVVVVGNVFSIGKKQTSFHVGASTVFDHASNQNVFLGMLGFRVDTSKRISLFGEYIFASSDIEISNDPFDGYLCIGARFRWDKISWEIGGFRPMVRQSSNFLFFPIIKATIML